jgi:hypothetical protein
VSKKCSGRDLGVQRVLCPTRSGLRGGRSPVPAISAPRCRRLGQLERLLEFGVGVPTGQLLVGASFALPVLHAQAAGRSTSSSRAAARSTSSGATGDPEWTTWASCRGARIWLPWNDRGPPDQRPWTHSSDRTGTLAQQLSASAIASLCQRSPRRVRPGAGPAGQPPPALPGPDHPDAAGPDHQVVQAVQPAGQGDVVQHQIALVC